MNDIGKVIEKIRTRQGLSRGELAHHLGVTVQTVLNLEGDPDYNLGTRLLRRLDEALGGEFHIGFQEAVERASPDGQRRVYPLHSEELSDIRREQAPRPTDLEVAAR